MRNLVLMAFIFSVGCSTCQAPPSGTPEDAGNNNPVDAATLVDAFIPPADAAVVVDAAVGQDAGGGLDAGALDAGNQLDAGIIDAGTGSDAAGPACATNAECDIGNICFAGECVVGCDGDRDCGGRFCEPNIGPHGQCVECVVDDHCPTDGSCINNSCATCVADEECPLGNICEGDCVAGCRDNRDCGQGDVCLNALCVEGCALSPDSCAPGTFCDGTVCTLGCNDDDERCPGDESCIEVAGEFTCARSCADDNDCGNREVCDNDVCIDGCFVNDDCGFLTPICDGAQNGDPGTCRACDVDGDCRFGRCDAVSGTCRADCFGNNDLCIGDVCDTASDLCVSCLEDSDCETGQNCSDHVCSAATCDTCSADEDCAGSLRCIVIDHGSNVRERVCLDSCDNGCDQGLTCGFAGFPAIEGEFCIPGNGVAARATCAAFRATSRDQGCVFDGQCGLPFVGDAACQSNVCTLPCENAGADCPADFDCNADGFCAP